MGVLGIGAMPLLLADSLGLFKQQGLNVSVLNVPAGGVAVLRAVLGGTADVALGSYDHTIQMQVQGKDLQGIVLNGTLPGLVLAVRAELTDRVKTVADFKGLRIGVAVLGSPGDAMVRTMLNKAGVGSNDVAIVGIGSGDSVLAAVERKVVDLIVNDDPVMTILERLGKIRVLTDTRTEAGCIAAFGGPYPLLCLYALRDFVERNPVAVQRLTNALVGGLRYLHAHYSAELLDAVAPKYKLGERSLAIAMLDKSRQMFSRDGRFDPVALQTPLRVISAFESKIAAAQVDLSRTYSNAFVDAVPPPP
jgi:NitT/TauT family transport system substrate-binding protein